MATQTLEFNCTTGLTITCKLFAVGSDTLLGSAIATEKTNDKNRYSVDFEDLDPGAVRLNGFVSGVGGFVNEIYDLLATGGTYYPRSESSGITQAELNTSLEGIPRYGETQRWNNGTDTIDVSITEVT